MPHYPDSLIKEILTRTKTIAVVGISARETQPSHYVAKYLLDSGYTVVPVNPTLQEVLGQRCYPSLLDIPLKVDMVDCFRATQYLEQLVKEAVQIKAHTVWMQLGLEHPEATKLAEAQGLQVIQDRCTKIEHQRLFLAN